MNNWLDSVLRCPKTGAELVKEGNSYVSTGTPAYRYRIEDGVPILLPQEAELVEDSDSN